MRSTAAPLLRGAEMLHIHPISSARPLSAGVAIDLDHDNDPNQFRISGPAPQVYRAARMARSCPPRPQRPLPSSPTLRSPRLTPSNGPQRHAPAALTRHHSSSPPTLRFTT